MYKDIKTILSFGICLFFIWACSESDGDGVTQPGDEIRVLFTHAAPGAPEVDLIIDNEMVVSNSGFSTFSDYVDIENGDQTIRIQIIASDTSSQDTTMADSSAILVDTTIVADNSNFSVFLADTGSSMTIIVLEDDLTRPASGNAKVRFVHLTPDAPPIDFFTVDSTANDTTASDTTAQSDSRIVFQNVAFKEASEFTSMASGTYNFQLKATNTGEDLLEISNVEFESRGIYTIFTRGFMAGMRPEVIVNRD